MHTKPKWKLPSGSRLVAVHVQVERRQQQQRAWLGKHSMVSSYVCKASRMMSYTRKGSRDRWELLDPKKVRGLKQLVAQGKKESDTEPRNKKWWKERAENCMSLLACSERCGTQIHSSLMTMAFIPCFTFLVWSIFELIRLLPHSRDLRKPNNFDLRKRNYRYFTIYAISKEWLSLALLLSKIQRPGKRVMKKLRLLFFFVLVLKGRTLGVIC